MILNGQPNRNGKPSHVMLRTMQVAAAALLIVATTAKGQPTREVPGGLAVTVPDRVEIRQEGKIELITKEVIVRDKVHMAEVLPTSVPVFTLLKAGEVVRLTEVVGVEEVGHAYRPRARTVELRIGENLTPGQVLREGNPRIVATESGAKLSGHYVRIPERSPKTETGQGEDVGTRNRTKQAEIQAEVDPLRVSLSGTGGYVVETATVGMSNGAQPNYFRSGSESIEVLYRVIDKNPPLPRSDGAGTRAAWTLNIQWEPVQLAAFPQFYQDALNAILARVKARFETLMVDSFGFETITVQYDDPTVFDFGGPNAIAATGVILFSISGNYAQMRERIDISAEANNEGNDEILLYENLPHPPLLVHFDDMTGNPSAVNTVSFTAGIGRHFGFAMPPATYIMHLRLGQPFDIYPDRRKTPPSLFDLEGTITHETIHALGFYCGMEVGGPAFPKPVTMWDLFRLEQVGPSVPYSVFNLAPREFRSDWPAIAVTEANSPLHTYPLSQGLTVPGGSPGDGFGASHWKAHSLTGMYIGIMDPVSADASLMVPGYLTTADTRALDIGGWNINPAAVIPPAGPATNQAPAPDQTGVSVAPTFTWTAGTDAQSFGLFVCQGHNTQDLRRQVLAVSDLAISSYAAMPGTLRPGETYSWSVTSYNPSGFDFSTTTEFTTNGCRADWDGNGAIEPADCNAFINAWFGDLNTGVLLADFDGNGSTEPGDVSLFISTWFAALNGSC